MTWNEMSERIQTATRESGGYLRTYTNLVADQTDSEGPLDKEKVLTSLLALGLATSRLHDAVTFLSLGTETIVEALREATDA